MYKQYFRQAWNLMTQNRFYSTVYIIGTGMAIAMVMVLAIVFHARTANIAPEIHRDRMLLVPRAAAIKKDEQGMMNSNLSRKTVKECFYTLQTPELVAVGTNPDNLNYLIGDIYTKIPGGADQFKTMVMSTDANFWKMFQFSFIHGNGYLQADFESGIRKVVLSETMARKIFGKTDVINLSVMVNEIEYNISGVVKDVSSVMSLVYADIWVPYTTLSSVTETSNAENIVGTLQVYILAKEPADFPKIRKEMEQKRLLYNTTLKEYKYEFRDGIPYTQKEFVLREMDYREKPHVLMWKYSLIGLIFLLVPAVNLSGLTSSRMRKRISELGIRKAFGANRNTLISQVLVENLLLTFTGGIVGLILSYILILGLKGLLLGPNYYTNMNINVKLDPGMMINFPIFIYAFIVCVLLNLLSAFFPVWRATKTSIVEAINDK